MKTIVIFLGIILLAMLALAVGGGLLTLLAYGVGWVINRVMGIESFQATALSLAGILVFIFLADRLSSTRMPASSYDFDDDDDDDEMDDDDIVKNEDALNKLYAGIPRWRRPNKNLDFSNVKPDDLCPCGSGRKYKNCHGVKQKNI
jgi:hypothetical protein